jgi:hypothetical protein
MRSQSQENRHLTQLGKHVKRIHHKVWGVGELQLAQPREEKEGRVFPSFSECF